MLLFLALMTRFMRGTSLRRRHGYAKPARAQRDPLRTQVPPFDAKGAATALEAVQPAVAAEG